MDHSVAPAILSRMQIARAGGDEAAELLRQAGCRPTPQRLLVLQALGDGGHVTAEQALAHARARYPSVNASTIYRTLEALTSAGLARASNLGGPSLHYELVREHLHHHCVCARCGTVIHLHHEELRPLAAALRRATGYELAPGREIAIPGVCPDCQLVEAARGEWSRLPH